MSDEQANEAIIVDVIWGRVKYKWKNDKEYILLQEKITIYKDRPLESEWVSVGFE